MDVCYKKDNSIVATVRNATEIPRKGDLIKVLNTIFEVSIVVWHIETQYVEIQLR